jgi:hypothetical protein
LQTKKKKPYEKPLLRKVRLEVRTSVLAVCNTSTNFDPKTDVACSAAFGCYNPPTP